MIVATIKTDYAGFDYLNKGSAIHKAIRIAANRASSKVKANLIANTPRKLGYLKKSPRIKVTLKKKPNSGVVVRVGPGSKLEYKKGKYKTDTKRHKKGELIVHKPSRYAHLAERKYHHTKQTHDQSERQYFADIEREIISELRKAESLVKA